MGAANPNLDRPLLAIEDAISAAIVTIDRNGVVRYANRGLERMFGFPTQSIVGRNVTVLMSEPDANEHDEHIARYLTTDEARIIGIGRNVFGRRSDGSTFPIHLAVEEIETEAFRGYLGIMTDQSALKLTEPRLSAAVDVLSEGFALFDESERLILANERYREILALSRQAVRPGTMFDDHVKGVGAQEGPLARGALHARPPGQDSRRYTLPKAKLVDARLTRLASGDAIVGLRDLSDEAARAMALSRAERLRALGELTGGVAHDFNNLLAVVIGNLELLEQRLTDEDASAMVAEALEAAEIGARLTDRLLSFARRQPLIAERIDVNAMIGDVSAILQRTLGRQIELEFDLGEGVGPVVADRGALEAGLINLATNARDAMPDGGRLTIATRHVVLDGDAMEEVPSGSFVRISVSDRGLGMPPHVATRVFEPFFTTKEKGRGSGLGLSSLYGFVKQSGGTVTVTSTLGQGSTFDLFLPTPSSAAGAPARAVAVGPLASKTILVVDDDPQVRRLSARHVRALGAHVIEAANGQEALALASDWERIDGLFSDIVMPGGIDGPELASRLRERWPGLPVLLTTGFSDSASAATARFAVLRKPFRQGELREALLRAMALAGTAAGRTTPQ